MNLKHLAVFYAVARTGSINQAAKKLYVSQPAISRQIRLLEESLGLSLFDRLPRGVRLTDSGRVLAEDARRIFALVKQAESSLEDIRLLSAGKLALGASTTIANYLLPSLLTRFQTTHPAIDVRLEVGNTEDIQGLLLEDSITAAFTEGFVDHPELVSEVFMRDELFVVAPSDHPLTEKPAVTLNELCKYPMVMREEGSGTRAVLERHLMLHNIHIKPHITLGSTDAVKSAVRCGAGVAALSRLAVQNELEMGFLRTIHVEGMRLYRDFHMVRHRDRGGNPAVSAFLDLFWGAMSESSDA